ncbi:pyrimidine-nucleoside phosphorylase [Selenomonas sp. FOBRC6]|uniref:thymidine phosphorylase n=1 Tax=Selenomonas sp. FOBRC6 TaxID=936572 RepID=UPI000278236D|nr:thymidine phosphorylase [Selenomonas sp. FOBRC6]EJO22383.1 pyrimidine-nucleoside phosphorylase [Selenomonas sp. FOBRC6]
MNMYDIITKKKHGSELTADELSYIIDGYVAGEIPDYQVAALLMAICLRGMTIAETTALTKIMAASGDRVDLSAIVGHKIDKHSTGGVGDKTTLIVSPIVAACGCKAPKMSGRGLGHTGGTIDKLESIPGFRTNLSQDEFIAVVKECGLSLIAQTGTLAHADKLLYALRDVTATVDSIPLIASSIMSKKLASGADAVLLDVKVGHGAFMKTLEDACALAETMVAIGKTADFPTAALLTNMDAPLGCAVGNSLEVAEAVSVLRGAGSDDLRTVSLALAAGMLQLAGQGTFAECHARAEQAIASGAAFDALVRMTAAQGGDISVLHDVANFPQAHMQRTITADADGYLTRLDAETVGRTAVLLGAGRMTKESAINHAAGIILHKKYGDTVTEGAPLATLYAESEEQIAAGAERFRAAFEIGSAAPAPMKLIYGAVDAEGWHER